MTHCDTSKDNLEVTRIIQNDLNGYHFKNKTQNSKGAVVAFGGSEGGCNYVLSELLASEGYEVLALYFFGRDSLPQYIKKIPLEFFQSALDYIGENFSSSHPLTVVGFSKGAELSLLLGTVYKEISNIVLIAPTAYVIQGMDPAQASSSWTFMGRELPYIHMADASFKKRVKAYLDFFLMRPSVQKPLLNSAIKNSSNLEAARIKVENFGGNILMLLGEDDMMWDSHGMAGIIERARPHNTEIISYKNVGHAFGEKRIYGKILLGGDDHLNMEAQEKSDRKIIDTLNNWHMYEN